MMKFGLLTAILDGWTYEEAVDIAAQMGFRCLEVACWPAGKAERRYAGVSHIDCARVRGAQAQQVNRRRELRLSPFSAPLCMFCTLLLQNMQEQHRARRKE